MKKINDDNKLLVILFSIFILTEIIADILDWFLGYSLLHSIIQLILFIVLFIVAAKMFLGYYNKKVKTLIPKELRDILEIIKESEIRNTKTNLVTIRKRIDVTKPTLKKRIDNLLYLNYIVIEKEGNNKYIKITDLGESLLK